MLPKSSSVSPQTLEQLQTLESQLRERDEKLSQLLSGKKALDDELQRLRIEVAETKQQNSARADDHDYSEAETRDYFIDLLLKEAGWALINPQDREFPVTGMPNNTGEGFVDYVLWGDDGKPLGLVEAKRTKRDSRVGQQQAKLYADCLEKQFGQRPVLQCRSRKTMSSLTYMIRELDLVALRKSIPGQNLKAGDVGTVVLVHKEGEAFEVEFLATDGETVAIVTVNSSQVRPALNFN